MVPREIWKIHYEFLCAVSFHLIAAPTNEIMWYDTLYLRSSLQWCRSKYIGGIKMLRKLFIYLLVYLLYFCPAFSQPVLTINTITYQKHIKAKIKYINKINKTTYTPSPHPLQGSSTKMSGEGPPKELHSCQLVKNCQQQSKVSLLREGIP